MSNIETSPGTLPHDLARRIGADPDFNEIHDQPSPQTMLGWAIRWAQRGLHLFPCKSFLGSPIPQKWYSVATSDIAQLVEWWNEIPNADIAAVAVGLT